MANNSDLGAKLALVGVGVLPASYGSGTLFYAGAATGLAVQLVFTFDGATVLTSINVKLQGQYSVAAGMADIQCTRQDNGTTANETVIVAAAAGPVWLQTQSNRYCLGGLQLIAKGVGGAAKAGDGVTGYVVAW